MKKLKSVISAMAMIFVVVGCKEPTPPELKNIGNSYTCKNSCETEWARAQAWIAKHSVTSIGIASENLIQNRTPILSKQGVYILTANKINKTITLDVTSTHPLGMVGGTYDDVPKYFYYYLKTGIDIYTAPSVMGMTGGIR